MAQDAPLPVTGSSRAPTSDVDPFTPDYIFNPYTYHHLLRDMGPLIWLERYGCYLAPRYKEVHAIVADPATYSSAAGVGHANFNKEKPWRPPSLLLEADPPDHTRRRAIVGRILSAPNLRGFRPAFEAEANKLIDRMLEKRDVEAVGELAQPYVLKVFPDAVGLSPENRQYMLTYGGMVFNAFGPQNDIFKASMQGVAEVQGWILEQCKRENLEPGKLGDQVYRAVEGGQISEDEALVLVRSFLSAGVDTTVDAVGNALYSFALHPAEWAKVKANPAMVPQAFAEVLRWESPFQTFFRTTTRDVEIAGVGIPANEKVMVSMGSANRDPAKWNWPHEFNVDRNPRDHVGFGYGIHACIGQMISRLENEVMLTELAKRKVDFTITGPTRHKLHNTLRGFDHLPLRFTQS